tara:strand:- start:132 stop:455 length:324 start_codon:yes stop_codon:yes gene_type:complete
MKVIGIQNIWNEIDYLPLKIKWCEKNNIEPYIIDNMSDDGSWEWLQKNNIPSHRFDTGGAFHLSKLNDEMTKTLHKIKPSWIIYMGCDEFFVGDKPLIKTFKQYDKE